jgi:hypothetical protein
VRRLAHQIGAAGNPLCMENPSFPHSSIVGHLSKDRRVGRYAFAREYEGALEDTPAALNVTWFSVEVQFHLDGFISNQNVRFGGHRV